MERRDARLLLVDEEPSSRVATHHALRALGCRLIDEAGDAPRAVQLLAEQDYDLIISGWAMQTIDAAELLKLIRHTPRLATIPVVIAARVTPSVVAEAACAGVSAFWPRPFCRQALEELVQIFIGGPAVLEPRHQVRPLLQ
ncbi:MAG: response regulator [Archangium sp.]|nr:response regulator [Archangium sp.]